MRVLVSDTISEKGLDVLQKKYDVVMKEYLPGELLNNIENFDALIVRSRTKVTRNVIDAGKNLKVIGRAGVGVDNIDVSYATNKRIPVVFAPRASTISVAELTFGHMLCLARMIPQAHMSLKKRKWEKKRFIGVELHGKTLGLVGMGRIGSAVAERAKIFGMKVIVYDPYISKEMAEKVGATLMSLDDVIKKSDFISIHAMLTDETRGMINKEKLNMMKSTAYIINCARGGIINENDLYDALKENKIAGAALDVYNVEPPLNSKLLELDNIIFTPHIGASTHGAQERAGIIVAEQVDKVLSGEVPEFIVNKEVLG